jgi:hypothetical protein
MKKLGYSKGVVKARLGSKAELIFYKPRVAP